MKKFLALVKTIILLVAVAVILFLGYNFAYVLSHPITLSQLQPQTGATVIYDRTGKEYTRLGSGIEKSNRSESFPDAVKMAVVCVEDHRFYTHHGVDVMRTGKAILDTLTNGKYGAGGSTITQQLVKNATGARSISINRKVREWFYAVSLEQKYSKEEILTQYLNIIYMGKGLYGMTDAAEYYFGCKPDQLSINQSAFLAGIIKSPETYVKDLDKGNTRKNVVLSYMEKYGAISSEKYASLKMQNVSINSKSRNGYMDWFTESAVEELAERVGSVQAVYEGGYKIYSTVDPAVQAKAESEWASFTNLQSGIVILNTEGKVRGIVGSTGKKSGDLLFNRALSAKRQPGSAIKPLAVYAPALEKGLITPLSILEDREITYSGGYTPKNYYSGYKGFMDVPKALEISNNTIPVQILNDLGTGTSYNYLKSLGFENIVAADRNLALAVGAITNGVTPMEMASGYQCLANGGVWCEPTFFERVEQNGKVIYDASSRKTQRVFSEQTAYMMTSLLTRVVEGPEGTARTMQMSNQVVAAKTGTTNDAKDKWLCAYTPYYVVAAWFGHDTPASIQATSSSCQKHVASVMTSIHSGFSSKSFAVPANIAKVNVCNVSGCLANEYCEETHTVYVDVSKQYETCQACTGTVLEEIQDGIEEAGEQVQDFFEGFWEGLFGGNNAEGPVEPVVEEPQYEEPQYEEPQQEPATEAPYEEVQEEVYYE